MNQIFLTQEMIMGGLVVETSLSAIVSRMNEQEKLMKNEKDLFRPHVKNTLGQMTKKTSQQVVLPRLNYFNLVG